MFRGVRLTTEATDNLIERLRGRDEPTILAIVEEHARPLYRAARGMGFRDHEAEDLAQEVLTTFIQTLDRFEGRSQVKTWLFGILHHKVHERRRALGRESMTDSIDDTFESRFDADGNWVRPPIDLERLVASKQIGQAIRGCVETLPDSQREVFVLRELEELDTQEICKILGRTVTHVGVLFHRARARLRECLEAQGWKRPA